MQVRKLQRAISNISDGMSVGGCRSVTAAEAVTAAAAAAAAAAAVIIIINRT